MADKLKDLGWTFLTEGASYGLDAVGEVAKHPKLAKLGGKMVADTVARSFPIISTMYNLGLGTHQALAEEEDFKKSQGVVTKEDAQSEMLQQLGKDKKPLPLGMELQFSEMQNTPGLQGKALELRRQAEYDMNKEEVDRRIREKYVRGGGTGYLDRQAEFRKGLALELGNHLPKSEADILKMDPDAELDKLKTRSVGNLGRNFAPGEEATVEERFSPIREKYNQALARKQGLELNTTESLLETMGVGKDDAIVQEQLQEMRGGDYNNGMESLKEVLDYRRRNKEAGTAISPEQERDNLAGFQKKRKARVDAENEARRVTLEKNKAERERYGQTLREEEAVRDLRDGKPKRDIFLSIPQVKNMMKQRGENADEWTPEAQEKWEDDYQKAKGEGWGEEFLNNGGLTKREKQDRDDFNARQKEIDEKNKALMPKWTVPDHKVPRSDGPYAGVPPTQMERRWGAQDTMMSPAGEGAQETLQAKKTELGQDSRNLKKQVEPLPNMMSPAREGAQETLQAKKMKPRQDSRNLEKQEEPLPNMMSPAGEGTPETLQAKKMRPWQDSRNVLKQGDPPTEIIYGQDFRNMRKQVDPLPPIDSQKLVPGMPASGDVPKNVAAILAELCIVREILKGGLPDSTR